MSYEAPQVRDYGTVVQVTQAITLNGPEDGMSKLVPIHHSVPAVP